MYITFYGSGALFWPPPVVLYLKLEIKEYEREREKERERKNEKKREGKREGKRERYVLKHLLLCQKLTNSNNKYFTCIISNKQHNKHNCHKLKLTF